MRLRLEGWIAAVPWGRGLLPLLVVLFILVRVGEAKGTAPVWIRHYADDLLSLPLVLGLTLMAHRLVARDHRTLPLSHGLFAVAVFAVYFEWILPLAGTASVADPLDVLMYLAGFLVFQGFLNRGVADRSDRTDIPGKNFTPPTRPNIVRRNHGHL